MSQRLGCSLAAGARAGPAPTIRSSTAIPIGIRISGHPIIGGGNQARYSFAGLLLPRIRLNLDEKALIARHNWSPFFQPKAIQGEKNALQGRLGGNLVAF